MQTSKTMGDWITDMPRPAVACTIVKITGSAPQQAGVKMWVSEKLFLGTLGGGEFERRILEDARELLRSGSETPLLKEYVLCKEMGQCCGGRVEVFFEPVVRKKTIHLFGGGHVGRATAQVLSGMPFQSILIDPRTEWSRREGVPADVQIAAKDPVRYVESVEWSNDDAVCIFTHSHDLDLWLIRFFLDKPVGYLGLIGSEHKSDVFKARLASNKEDKESVEALWDEKVRCPIGVPLRSKNPKVIAVSIAAELLREWGFNEKPASLSLSGRAR